MIEKMRTRAAVAEGSVEQGRAQEFIPSTPW